MDITNKKKTASRKLSIYEYFETLQVEYLVANLRHRIYPTQKDKAYYQKVMEGKRRTIEEIGERNQLPTIFFDSDKKRAFEEKIYGQAIPNFYYKDTTQKEYQEYYDLINFYAEGTEVRCEVNDEYSVGVIKKYTPFAKELVVVLKDTQEELSLSLSLVRRIL